VPPVLSLGLMVLVRRVRERILMQPGNPPANPLPSRGVATPPVRMAKRCGRSRCNQPGTSLSTGTSCKRQPPQNSPLGTSKCIARVREPRIATR
jgi:hypothetical protein